MAKFTQIPENTFEELQINAGVLLSSFDPANPTLSRSAIIGATTGGISFTDTPTYEDFAADVDNAAKNMKEFKRITAREIVASGTHISISAALAKRLAAAADAAAADANGMVKITPRDYLVDSDFTDLWIVGDYSDKNGATNGGFIAVKLMNALNTSGFSMQTGEAAKGQFAFSYMAHYSIDNPDTVPYEMYIAPGDDEPTSGSTTNTTNPKRS